MSDTLLRGLQRREGCLLLEEPAISAPLYDSFTKSQVAGETLHWEPSFGWNPPGTRETYRHSSFFSSINGRVLLSYSPQSSGNFPFLTYTFSSPLSQGLSRVYFQGISSRADYQLQIFYDGTSAIFTSNEADFRLGKNYLNVTRLVFSINLTPTSGSSPLLTLGSLHSLTTPVKSLCPSPLQLVNCRKNGPSHSC